MLFYFVKVGISFDAMNKRKIAFVTGASSGIGAATARALAFNNYDLILCGRREDRLERLSKELEDKVPSIVLVFDTGKREGVMQAINTLQDKWKNIDLLVNNAGNAHGKDELVDGDLDDWDAMIDSNVKGLLYVSKAIIPGMKHRKRGHVVNISSVAGKETYAGGTVYCASKHAVEAISEGMRKELVPHGIKVTNIAPGAVETEFSNVRFKGDKDAADMVYNGFDPLVAKDIASAVIYCVTAPDNVQVADMTILAARQYAATGIKRDNT